MKILDKIIKIILVAIVAVMVIGCAWQVITRFILNSPSKYTEELLRYLLIWLTMLGTPYAYGQGQHLSINALTNTFKPINKMRTKIFVEVIVLFLSVTVLIIGGIMVTLNAGGQISSSLQMPMELYYGCLPICGVLMVIYAIKRLFEHIHVLKEGE